MKKVYLTIQIKDILDPQKPIKIQPYNKKNDLIQDVYWHQQVATNTETIKGANKNKAQQIYEQLTDLFFYEDIYIYSCEELFIDITNYLSIYNLTSYNLALKVKNLLRKEIKVVIKCGIGSNLFLAKTACNILTKQRKTDIVSLTEKEFIKLFSTYETLTDFWQISPSMKLKLNELEIKNMEDIRNYDYSILYNEFGYNAEYLINHSMGLEPATLLSLEKNRIPKRLVASEVFQESKNKKVAVQHFHKLVDYNILKLLENNCKAKEVSVSIKYSYNIKPQLTYRKNLSCHTDSYQLLSSSCLELLENNINLFIPIEKITITFDKLSKAEPQPMLTPAIHPINHSWQKKFVTMTKKWKYPFYLVSSKNFSFK